MKSKKKKSKKDKKNKQTKKEEEAKSSTRIWSLYNVSRSMFWCRISRPTWQLIAKWRR